MRSVQGFNKERNAPIEFYGQVIDQNSHPLAGVKIKISIPQEYMFAPTASGDFPISNNIVRLEKETDADGRFEITGERGYGVDMDLIQKDGYEVEPAPSSHGNMEGSFNAPVVFKMWPKNLHEQLIGGEKNFHITPDGRPYFINLTTGEITESNLDEGDLKVWIKYPEQVERGQSYPWACEIDVIHGGLLEEPLGTTMFMAPTEGYVPSFSLRQQIREGQRGSIGDRPFYVMLNNGKIFGRIQIDLMAPYNPSMGIPGLIRLSYAINPSGSRILR
jgi:hypothetical protein